MPNGTEIETTIQISRAHRPKAVALPKPAKARREDPLADVKYQGKMEPDSKAEIAALSDHFKALKADHARIRNQALARGDSEYWVCVVFQSRAQKEEFLRNADLIADGDKYLDGAVVAKKLGVAMTPECSLPPGESKIDPRLAELARQ